MKLKVLILMNTIKTFFFHGWGLVDDILRIGSQISLGKSSKEPIMEEWKAEQNWSEAYHLSY